MCLRLSSHQQFGRPTLQYLKNVQIAQPILITLTRRSLVQKYRSNFTISYWKPNGQVLNAPRIEKKVVRHHPVVNRGRQLLARILNQFLSDRFDVKSDPNEGLVIKDLAAVKDEGRLLHRRVDSLVVQRPEDIKHEVRTLVRPQFWVLTE